LSGLDLGWVGQDIEAFKATKLGNAQTESSGTRARLPPVDAEGK